MYSTRRFRLADMTYSELSLVPFLFDCKFIHKKDLPPAVVVCFQPFCSLLAKPVTLCNSSLPISEVPL